MAPTKRTPAPLQGDRGSDGVALAGERGGGYGPRNCGSSADVLPFRRMGMATGLALDHLAIADAMTPEEAAATAARYRQKARWLTGTPLARLAPVYASRGDVYGLAAVRLRGRR